MRRALLALLVPVALAVAALAVVGAGDRRGLVSGVPVAPVAISAVVMPGQESCQQPISVAEAFGQVGFHVGTAKLPGPELVVTVRDADGTPLRSGRLEGGYPDNSAPVVLVGEVRPRRGLAVCIKNVGDSTLALLGSAGDLVPSTRVYLEGRPGNTELTMSFYTADRPSALGEVPRILERAALFRPGWVGAWTFWGLAVVLVVGVPLLLVGALRSSAGRGA
jgi:hypothetical protein